MIDLKSAPNFKEQYKIHPYDEVIILAGAKAWQAWNKGKGAEWKFFCQCFKHNEEIPPIILDEKQLKEVQFLKLAEPEHKYISVVLFGKITEEQKTAICLAVAKNTQATSLQFLDNIGQKLASYNKYIERLRQDEAARQTAEMIAPAKKEVMIDFSSEKPSQKQIAKSFLDWIDKPLRRDCDLGKPLEYNGLFWELIPEHHLQRKVLDFYDEFNGDYTARHLKSIADLVVLKCEEIPQQNPDLIGFQNGVLNKKTGEFLLHNINHYLRAVEKFDCCTKSKETPHFNDWLEFVTNGNKDRKKAILAGLYMVLTNRHEWGLFLEATGVAGAGKSVFSQIASIINGISNTAYISLQELEIDKKRAMLIGKSLAISPDQKPYKGSADELKAITGGDNITVKMNYIDDFAIKLNPVFMLVTNYPLLFTDRNGGISRRRIIIPFDRPIPKEKKDVHFIEKVQNEVYGIVNFLLAHFPEPEEARLILEAYKELDEGKQIKREANHLIDFLGHFELKEERKGALRLGSARSEVLNINNITGNDTLYSAYLFYCQCHNLTQLNVLSFKNALSDAFKETGEKIAYSEKMYYGYLTTNATWKNRDLSIRQWQG
ncbi:DUF5906 domain-containing protein [Lonepinella sp. MS14435]|uniref:DNA primase family protein n=1 Tax=Lonepinella sp. MS14435 TaxID=3003618 RepID=UPI0036DB87D3